MAILHLGGLLTPFKSRDRWNYHDLWLQAHYLSALMSKGSDCRFHLRLQIWLPHFSVICSLTSSSITKNKPFNPAGTWRWAEISWRRRCSRSWSPQPSAATSTLQPVTWRCSCGRMLWTTAVRYIWSLSLWWSARTQNCEDLSLLRI